MISKKQQEILDYIVAKGGAIDYSSLVKGQYHQNAPFTSYMVSKCNQEDLLTIENVHYYRQRGVSNYYVDEFLKANSRCRTVIYVAERFMRITKIDSLLKAME